ncbi:hypothetical protein V5O48_018097 [Marasmius crinis-equi]|uniref:NAD-dependent epimerase/dehydratase domain-containing protein n=1 Tax=Marasmius crinis-equi TaxID=585013 RepID=A0ABR3EM59_9AGAR
MSLSPQKQHKILLLGATGYVGGSVLAHLLTSEDPSIQEAPISVLVRGQGRAEKLAAAYRPRITVIPFDGLDDTELLAKLAEQHDLVINTGTGFHPPSAEALVRGLASRMSQNPSVPRPWLIHTSGNSNISDLPLTQSSHPDREWVDSDPEAIFAFEQAEQEKLWYPQRAAELIVLQAGEETGVGVVSLQAPLIFGTGSGVFNQAGVMIPIVMGLVLEKGYGFVLGDGTGVLDKVHVSDLADLYVHVVEDIVSNDGRNVPSGKKGIVFPEAGRVSIRQLVEDCLDMAFAAGHLPLPNGPQLVLPTVQSGTAVKPEPAVSKEIRRVDIKEAAMTVAGNEVVAETGWAGHRLTKGVIAKERLGWRPTRFEDAWRKDLVDEMHFFLEGKRGVTIDSCIGVK